MELKEYQRKVLERLQLYLHVLKEKQTDFEKLEKLAKEQGLLDFNGDELSYCRKAWDELNKQRLLPLWRDKDGSRYTPRWLPRHDGMKREIPNVCFKVPTGGGKTLLAASALERVNVDFFGRQTGFVLWVVPSDSIYRQTWNAFANREHPYRQVMERASGGRVRLLEKTDHFTPLDVQEHLCVMLLMLQSSARRSKETLRMFRDSGKFTAFFPEVDDFPANQTLLEQIPNLEVSDMSEEFGPITGVSIKQSLGNTLKLMRPIIVIDEGHKAYSDTARFTLDDFNPRFILELSATPNSGKEPVSNVLVDIPGTALKEEQMIKLPINVYNYDRADWKHTLTQAHGQLGELQKAGRRLLNEEGRYVRPILLVRAERTGKDQRDGAYVHAEDVREYLVEKLGAKPEEIAVKSATTDEIGDQDLLSQSCEIRYIITKDALREGWDCPFAYILAILSKTTAQTALTQMIGRVLRQPEALATPLPPLNESYVYCFDQDVNKAVDSVRRGLEEEGMADLGSEIRPQTGKDALPLKRVVVKRRERWRGLKVFLPRVLYKMHDGEYRVLDYDRDILGALDWSAFHFRRKSRFDPGDEDSLGQTFTLLDVKTDHDGQTDWVELSESSRLAVDGTLDFGFMARQLMDVIPNPWEGARILEETLAALRKREISEERIYVGRLILLKAMKSDLRSQVDQAAETLFRERLKSGDISFQLVSVGDKYLNWELRRELEIMVTDEDKILRKRNSEDLERSLFEKVYEKELNGLEKEVAWYLDGEQAVRWWHRIAAKQDYHLQGWQRNRIYPDFLICLQELAEGYARFALLETKGEQLKGNDDTDYKKKVMDLLSEHSRTAIRVGQLELGAEDERLCFKMLMEKNWRDEIGPLVNPGQKSKKGGYSTA